MMRLSSVALLFLFAAGCGAKHGGKDAVEGPDVVARLGDHHTLTAPVTVGNLTVWPVRTDRPLDLGEFLTLEEALAKGTAEVREVGGGGAAQQVAATPGQTRDVVVPQREASEPPPESQTPGQTDEPVQSLDETQQLLQAAIQVAAGGATVNTLVIENKGDLPILVCAGTVVKGGNQDRQIGQDFVIKAKSETPVDAFCVEPGRWQQERFGTDTGGKFQVLDGMATAKVRAKGQYEKDQQGVWQEVADVQQASFGVTNFGPAAESTSFADTFDASTVASREELRRCEDAVRARFAEDATVVGFAYAINGKPVAVRTFAHPRLLKKQLDDFVRGMATEALLEKTDAAQKPADAKDVVALVERISACEETVADTSGLNRNGVRVHKDGYNANCYVADQDGKLQPLTQDWTAK